MEVRILGNTISAEFGRLAEGQIVNVSENVAEHWRKHGVASFELAPPAPAAKGPVTEPENYPCTECEHEPFPTAAALKGHVTRTHPGTDYRAMISRPNVAPLEKGS